jgi:hypothetical protein
VGNLLVVLGVAAAAFGWFFLLGGVSIGTGLGTTVVNMHLLSIANNVIGLGYALVIAGLLVRLIGVQSTSEAAATISPTPRTRDEGASVGHEVEDAGNPKKSSQEMRKKIENAFQSRLNATVLVKPDGSVTVYKLLGSKTFQTPEEAWKALSGSESLPIISNDLSPQDHRSRSR